MPPATGVIQQLLAPVVMISAAGLVMLALFSRLATLVARVRAFAAERTGLVDRLSTRGGFGEQARGRVRLEALEAQAGRIIARARLVRNALACVVVSIIAMLGCSLLTGVSLRLPWASDAALAVFLVGVASMLVAMVLVLAELRRALEDAEMEHRVLSELGPTPPAQPGDEEPL